MQVGNFSHYALRQQATQLMFTEELTHPLYKGLHVYTRLDLLLSRPNVLYYSSPRAPDTLLYLVYGPAFTSRIGLTWRF